MLELFWSKALSSVAALCYVFSGQLPWTFVPVLFFSDIIYLPFFYVIWRRIGVSRLATR